MSNAPYYQGDTVKLKFEVSDKSGPIIPTSVDFAVVDETDYVHFEGQAIVEENEVTGIIPTWETKSPGVYTIIYTIRLPDSTIRTHKQTYRILPKGPVVSEEFDAGFPVTPSSTPNEILSGKSDALRALRRLGKSTSEVIEALAALTEKATNKRIAL